MFKVYACLTTDHDYRLVVLAAIVCLFASGTAVKLLAQVVECGGRERAVRLLIASSVTGIGVWATHFIAMLAFEPGLPVGYDLGLTVASLAAAILLIGAGFHVAAAGSGRLAPPAGGAVVGLGVGVMHYLGMAAFQVAGRIVWDDGLVAWSVAIGMGLGALALTLALPRTGVRRQAAASLTLTAAICGMHFTAMGAAAILPEGGRQVAASSLPSGWLAVWVASGALGILVLTAAAIVMERRQRRVDRASRQDLADTAVEGLVVCDDGAIVTVNASFEALAGLTGSELRNRSFGSLFDPAAADRLASGKAERFETTMVVGGAEPIPVELITRPLTFQGRLQQGVAVRDLRARQLADAQIRFMAHHDGLTGLHNRASFNERLDREMERHQRKDDAFAVLCLDLDRFKPINDMLGHAAGDAVLRAVSQRIGALLGGDDVFARLGGDEFAIIRLGDCRPVEIADLSERILSVVAEDLSVENHSVQVGVSIGIALFPSDGATADVLLGNADAALYQAKADGRCAYRFFEPSIGHDLRVRHGLEVDLRQAIARNELSLAFQPQTSVATGLVFGFEALLRWTHPQRGSVSPDVFIPVAEETGLILSIGEWVLRQSCAEAARWSKPLQIAVNISGVQLRSPHLAGLIATVLQETGLPGERLEVEVTETAMISDFDRAVETLNQIKALGVKIAMDDFGTGYSSLSNLRAFPFDKIKIDQSFVRNVHRNADAAAIVRAIVGLARGLKLTVLAEGVETLEELDFLNAEMCCEAQGFFLGRPSDIADFAKLTSPAPRRRLAG